MALAAARRVLLVGGMHQLVEVALLAVGGLLLEHHLQIILVEFLEEFLPGDLLELAVVAVRSIGELESDDPDVAAALCAFHLGGNCAARFCPPANLVVIPGCSRKRHNSLLPSQR